MAKAKKAVPKERSSRLATMVARLESSRPLVQKRRPNRTAEVVERVEAFLDKIAPDVVKRLTSAEMRANRAESELARIRERLIAHLTPEQIEVAKFCEMGPEFYAMELIDLWREGRVSKSALEIQLRPLPQVKMTGPY